MMEIILPASIFISICCFVIWAFYEPIAKAIVEEIDPDDETFMDN